MIKFHAPWLESENFLSKFRGNFNTIARSIFVMNKRDIEFLFLLIFFTRKKNKIKSGNKLAERCKRGGERLEKTDLYRV